jgi:general secretion pathway protein K
MSMPTPTPSGRKAPSRERGAALLTAMVAVAVLTAVAVDLAYSSRVSLQIAANARDELRAHYLARSGVQMGRLVLSFQQTLDKSLGQMQGVPRVQLWNLVPVDQDLTRALFPAAAGDGKGTGSGSPSLFDTVEKRGKPATGAGASGSGATVSATAASRPAAAEGRIPEIGPTFDARIDDEARKINAQLFGLARTGVIIRARAQSLYQLICDARWDPLFDREDANGQRTSREDLLVRLYDWVNVGNVGSALRPGPGTTNAQCGLVLGQPPFEAAFSDKNQPYDRGDDRYKTKNAQMDSVDELYLVAGIGDAFMAAFGDSLTVYLKEGDKQNINGLDKAGLLTVAGVVAAPGQLVMLSDPEFANKLQKAIVLQTAGGILSLTTQSFATALQATGLQVNQTLLTAQNGPFTDRSNVFRIRATGKVGAVRSGIDAVVRFDDQNIKIPGDQIAAPGRIVHWREE